MSPLAGEGCWAPAGLPRFLEDPALLFGRHSFVTTLVSENDPATMSTISRHRHHHGCHPSSLLSLATPLPTIPLLSPHIPVITKDCHYRHCH